MSILDLQKRARRLGEIRMGAKGPKGQPVKLETWRLTSSDADLIEQAAERYGGTSARWGDDDKRWEVVTDTDTLPVIVPPQDPENVTWYEAWSAGGLQRRCNGQEVVSTDPPSPCQCDPDKRACNMTTRLSLILPELRDIGSWKFESHGYNAAVELNAAVDIIFRATQSTGELPRAELVIEHRQVKRPGQPTHRFIVPVLKLGYSFAELLPPALGSPTRPVLAPTPPPPSPPGTVVVEEPDRVHHITDGEAGEPDSTGWEASPNLTVVDPEGQPPATPESVLRENPTDGTIDDIRERLNRLYAGMTYAGVWGDDAFRKHLAAYMLKNELEPRLPGEIHWADLRRREHYEPFAAFAFAAAERDMQHQGEQDADTDEG